MSEEQQISDGERVARFLADEAVSGAIERLEAKYVEEWKSGKTPADRENAWGKSRALDDLRIELQAVVDSGTRAAAERDRRERASTRRG